MFFFKRTKKKKTIKLKRKQYLSYSCVSNLILYNAKGPNANEDLA